MVLYQDSVLAKVNENMDTFVNLSLQNDANKATSLKIRFDRKDEEVSITLQVERFSKTMSQSYQCQYSKTSHENILLMKKDILIEEVDCRASDKFKQPRNISASKTKEYTLKPKNYNDPSLANKNIANVTDSSSMAIDSTQPTVLTNMNGFSEEKSSLVITISTCLGIFLLVASAALSFFAWKKCIRASSSTRPLEPVMSSSSSETVSLRNQSDMDQLRVNSAANHIYESIIIDMNCQMPNISNQEVDHVDAIQLDSMSIPPNISNQEVDHVDAIQLDSMSIPDRNCTGIRKEEESPYLIPFSWTDQPVSHLERENSNTNLESESIYVEMSCPPDSNFDGGNAESIYVNCLTALHQK